MGRKTWFILLGLAMIVASCGGDGDGAGAGTLEGDTETTAEADNGGETSSDEPTTTTSDTDTDTDGADLDFPFETGEGFYEVDGQRFEVQVARCIPDQPGEGNLDLTLFESRMTGADISLTRETMLPASDDEFETLRFRASVVMDRAGERVEFESPALATDPEGDWFDAHPNELALGGSDDLESLEESPIVVEGSNVKGVVQMEQTFPEGASGTVLFSYEVTLPSEEVDCS